MVLSWRFLAKEPGYGVFSGIHSGMPVLVCQRRYHTGVIGTQDEDGQDAVPSMLGALFFEAVS